jgi:hypothetical protein
MGLHSQVGDFYFKGRAPLGQALQAHPASEQRHALADPQQAGMLFAGNGLQIEDFRESNPIVDHGDHRQAG